MRRLKRGLKNVTKGANNLRKKIQPIIKPILCFIWKVIKILIRKVVKIDIIFLIIGIFINVVICKIFPQFPKGFPVIYGWFDGWVQLNLFIVKSVVNGVYAISEGNWKEFRLEFNRKFHEMVVQFVQWVNNIKI